MNKPLLLRLLQATALPALALLLLTGALAVNWPTAAAKDEPTSATPGQPPGADWDGAAPPPLDPLDASMPPSAAGLPSSQPIVVAEPPARPVVAARAAAPGALDINLWYGPAQTFGQLGHPQGQINLLGNVTGTLPITLSYSLNGGVAQPLELGPDDERLADVGDFNIAISRTNLISGLNQVVITATDALSPSKVLTAQVTYLPDQVWPLPYSINWATVSNLQDVAQVVDGHWAVDAAGLRPLQLDYDRLVAIGDDAWQDYEVVAPVLIRGIDPSGFDQPSNGPGIGFIADWQGHTMLPSDTQLPSGWRTQLGALAWYRWLRNDGHTTELRGLGGSVITSNALLELSFNVQYMMKLSVQRRTGAPNYYRFKVWPASSPEPAVWAVETAGRAGSPVSGSLLLLAHHVDATFGNIEVRPLSTLTATLTVGTQGDGEVVIDPPAAQYAYGDKVQLTASGNNGAFFDGWTGDITSKNNPLLFDITQNTAITANFTLTTTPPISSTLQSDDFNRCVLGPQWEFVNPLGDGVLTTTGTQALLTVPDGISHNVYDNGIPAPRIMQTMSDTNFDVTVKFDSSVNRRFQVQGIVVEQDLDVDAEDFIRFDFFHDGTDTRLYAATVRNGAPTPQVNDIISPSGTTSYLRVRREGSVWTQSYSFDGVNYIHRNFTLTSPMTVTRVGVFAANHGMVVSPAHTAIIDYFFNSAAPIELEDGKPMTVTVNIAPVDQGAVGTVIVTPDQASYLCGDQITLTAQPEPGWRFVSWEGAATGSETTTTLTFAPGAAVTATFERDQQLLYLPLVAGGN